LRPEVYPRLATEALAGGLPRSSAGGEQPKFTAIVAKSDGPESVIVKFSPPLETPEGRRWADLLAAEAIAAEILRTAGFATAPSEWIDAGGRRFLEVARFDRTRNGGRIPFVSLLAHDAAFFGEMNTPWNDAAERLRSKGWLEAMDADRLVALWRFGRLIANTDMHYGNAALLLNDRPPLRLAPLYDMLPMAYRPGLENTIPALSEEMLARAESAAPPERHLALSFWQAVAESRHVSDSFRSIAQGHEKALRQRP
jgi:serine/threonine protein kinase HipA of HipAB toxin-antitoxin module